MGRPFQFIGEVLGRLVHKQDLRELLSGTSSALLLRVVGAVASYGFYVVLARVSGPDVTGLFALSVTVLNLVSLVSLLGTSTSVVRFIAQSAATGDVLGARRIRARILWFVLPLSVALASAVVIASPWLCSHVFHDPRLSGPLLAASLALPLRVALDVNTAAMRGLKRITMSLSLTALLLPTLNLAFLIPASRLAGSRLLVPNLAHLCSMTVCSALSFWLWGTASRSGGGDGSGCISLRRIMSVSWPMCVVAGTQYLMNWTDVIMLGTMRPAAEVGIYRVAARIAAASGVSLFAVTMIAAPKFAEAHGEGGSRTDLRQVARHASSLVFWMTVPVVLLSIAFAGGLLLLFGREFVCGRQSLVVLCAGQLCGAVFGPVGVFLNMCGKQAALRNVMLLGAGLNIALNAALIPGYGMLGASIATVVSMVVWTSLSAVVAYRAFGFWVGYAPLARWRRRDAEA